MELIFIITLTTQLIISLLARNEKTERKFLLKSAHLLYYIFFNQLLTKTGIYTKIEKTMANLHPGKDKESLTHQYFITKIRLSYTLVLIGNILALIISLSLSSNRFIQEGLLIPRNNWQQGSYPLELRAIPIPMEAKAHNITIIVEPVSLNEEQASILAHELISKLPTLILGKNLSLESITESLNLITRVDDYPFTITWNSDKPSLVRANGSVNTQGISSEGETVKLTAHLLYQDRWLEYQFTTDIFVNIIPYLVAKETRWEEAIIAAVTANQQEKAFSEFFKLPEMINGTTMSWQEIKAKDGLYLWLIIVSAAIIAFVGQDHDLNKKVTQRTRQIDRDYPELVRKLALYLGAGMTLRGAWKRVASDSIQTGRKAKYLYEELQYSVRELENGVSEREVYERFGKRVGIAKYRKLMGLLCNHLQKGNKNLLQVLREEMELALEDRKKAARTIGEEMSTKLLLPMMMMLLIVMIMIMVPAFQMF